MVKLKLVQFCTPTWECWREEGRILVCNLLQKDIRCESICVLSQRCSLLRKNERLIHSLTI